MKNPPAILVQLVHIQGPLKGEIQEFPGPTVTIGRNPSCDLHFPKDTTAISRQHAHIVREGNRFKLVDESTNGTFVNSKRVSEAFLKDGDVLTFSEGGPKVSFLTKIGEGQEEIQGVSEPDVRPASPSEPEPAPVSEPSPEPAASPPPPPPPPHTPQARPGPRSEIRPEPRPEPRQEASPGAIAEPRPQPVASPGPVPSPQRVQAPLVIQFGPTLRSFKELPIEVGKGPGSDFTLDHEAIADRHAEFFFTQGQYYIKDLTGQNRILINGKAVDLQSAINANDLVAFSAQGPVFRFLSGGRLVEVEPTESEEHAATKPHDDVQGAPKEKSQSEGANKAKALFKKFLRR